MAKRSKKHKLLFIWIITVALLITFAKQSQAHAAFLSNSGGGVWGKRADIMITEPIGIARYNEPIEITLHSELIKDGGLDIRITDQYGLEIPYQIVSANDLTKIYTITFLVNVDAKHTKNYYLYFNNEFALAPNYNRITSIIDSSSSTWQTDGVLLKWGGLAGYYWPTPDVVTALQFDDYNQNNPLLGADRLTDDQNAWDPFPSYGYIGPSIAGHPSGFGSSHGEVIVKGPVFTELKIGTARFRYYKDNKSWVRANNAVDSAFFFSKLYDYVKIGSTEEKFIPNNGPYDVGPWYYFYSTINPGYMAYRQSGTGIVFGVVATDVAYWQYSAKQSGGWDRILVAEGSGKENAKIYWYSDMSNSYEGIERFSKQVLNPLRVTLVMDEEPPVTEIRTMPEAPNGQNLYFITPVRIELFPNESSTTYYRWDGGEWQVYSSTLPAPNGSHLLEYYSVDNAGNAEQAKSYRVSVDSSPPSPFELLSPPDGHLGNNSVPTFSWLPSSDADSGLEGYDLFIDGLPVATVAESETVAPLLYPLPDGAHTWFVRARDKAGNYTDSETWTFTIDTAPPVTSIRLDPAHPDGDNGWYRTPVKVTLEATDSGSGVSETSYSFDGGSTWISYGEPFTLASSGITELLFKSVDAAGNEEAVKNQIIKIERAAPEAGIYFDPETKDLKVVGYDGLGGTIAASYTEHDLRSKPGKGRHDEDDDHDGECGKRGWKLRIYTLTDEAGNTLELAIKIKREGKQIKAELLSLSYNGADSVEAIENDLKFEWSVDNDGNVKVLNQNVELEGKGEVNALYSRKKGETSIKIKNGSGKPEVAVMSGLSLIRIVTSHGDLQLSY